MKALNTGSTSNRANRRVEAPSKRLGLRFLILVPLVIAMAAGCYVHIRSVCATYEAWTPVWLKDADFTRFDADDVHFSNPGVVEVANVSYGTNGAAGVTFRAVSDGATEVEFGDDALSVHWDMEVRHGTILKEGINFSGWEAIHVCLCIFFAVAAALCASVLVRLQRSRWFGYGMVSSCGGMLFLLFQCALFTALLVRSSLRDFSDLAYQLSSAADYFTIAAFGPMVVMALLVSVGNIALIRHEGLRPVNLLGIAVSLFWAAAMALWFWWWYIASAMLLPHAAVQLVGSALAVALAYGECLLIATILCAWIASRKEPDDAVDYLVVLGCGLRADGTPSPLLAGRVDRALAFDAKCAAAGGAPATFVPSGGQGPDEVVSEAQSMRDYLMGRGVELARIVLEDHSSTTRENMTFSHKAIEEHADTEIDKVSVGFSTTNYHVFRGYVCAHEAGIAAQGMGSKTRAYFWPNAFLREFAGLLVSRRRGILVTYAIITAVYGIAEYALILM